MPRVADPKVRRAEIVTATADLIAAKGPDALSMRNIAERASCTIGMLNHWFKSKDELIEAVLDSAASAAVRRCATTLERADVTIEDVVCEFLPLDEERSAELRVWLVFWALSIGRPQLRRGYARRVADMRRRLSSEIKSRGLVTQDIAKFVDTLMAALDGIAVNSLAEPGYWTPVRQRETLRWLLTRTMPSPR